MLIPYEPTPERPWNVRRVVHLHRRAGFAANWRIIQRDLRDGPQRAISRLLQGEEVEENASASDFEAMSAVICDAAVGSGDIRRLKAWWLYRMLFTPDPLTERLTLMWHNHFATSHVKVADVGLMQQQNSVLRQFSRAKFGQLLPRIATDPALLMWLDADTNRKEHPNENLAREIMELFTLGVGNYAEDDVKEAARALSGWTVIRRSFREYAEYHDAGPKTIFGQTGNWTGHDLVRMLLEHPGTARRLAFRICELLMGEALTNSLVEELASGLRERDLDIGWAVETVLRSETFFAEEHIGNRVLSPIEFIVGAVRALEVTDPPPSTLLLAESAAQLGQDLFVPPNVFGWPGGRSWLTSRSMIARANFASAFVRGELHGTRTPLDAAALASSHGFFKPKDVGSLFAHVLLGRPQLPGRLAQFAESPNDLLSAILASPEAQLG